VTTAAAIRRPPLRLHRPNGDAALDRVAVGVCREFGDADALTILRAARQMGRLALDAGEPDAAAAAAVVLVQLAIDRLEADAAAVCDGLAAVLDTERAAARQAQKFWIRRGRDAYARGRQRGREDVSEIAPGFGAGEFRSAKPPPRDGGQTDGERGPGEQSTGQAPT
jgi:hypothetical protein